MANSGPGTHYESTAAATEAILELIESRPEQSNWVDDVVSTVVVEDWTDALTGFQAKVTVTPAEDQSLKQIRTVYEECEPALKRQATALEIGTIEQFSPEETLFMVLVRDLQDSAVRKMNFNPHKFQVLLDERYTVARD